MKPQIRRTYTLEMTTRQEMANPTAAPTGISFLINSVVIAVSLFVGADSVFQTFLNIKVGQTLGGAIRGSWVSFVVGFTTLCICVITNRLYEKFYGHEEEQHKQQQQQQQHDEEEQQPQQQEQVEERQQNRWSSPQWYHSGGLIGVFYITMSIVAVPYIGFSLYYVCAVCGQLLAALLIDVLGVNSIHPCRVVGLGLTVVGSVMKMLADGEAESSRPFLTAVLILAALVAGMCLPLQACINTALKVKENINTIEACCFSFFIGSLAVSVLSMLTLISTPAQMNSDDNQFYHWFGGVIGVTYVMASVAFPPIIGYSTFFVLIVSGQLTLALLADIFGILGPVQESARGPLSIGGVVMATAGAAVVSYYNRPSTSPPSLPSTSSEPPSNMDDDKNMDDENHSTVETETPTSEWLE